MFDINLAIGGDEFDGKMRFLDHINQTVLV